MRTARTLRVATALAIASVMAAPACEDGGGGNGGGTLTSSVGTTGVGGAVASSATTATSTGTGPYDIACEGAHTNADESACGLITQDCGPYATCSIVGTASTCETALGLKGVGLTCGESGECKPGLVCLLGRCVNHCCPSTNEPCGNGVCQRVTINNSAFAHFCTYFTVCDLFNPTSCAADEGCFLDPFPNSDLTICVAYGQPTPAGDGEPCTAINDCSSAMECTNGSCRFLCDRNADAGTAPGEGGCPMGQVCNPTFGLANTLGTCG